MALLSYNNVSITSAESLISQADLNFGLTIICFLLFAGGLIFLLYYLCNLANEKRKYYYNLNKKIIK